jgi:hypothetical protein
MQDPRRVHHCDERTAALPASLDIEAILRELVVLVRISWHRLRVLC